MRKSSFAATAALLFLSMSFVPCSAFQLYPDGTYGPDGNITLAPDGSFHSGNSIQMYPDGSFGPQGNIQLHPDGTFGTGNGSSLRPDGSFGTTPDFEMTPDGTFVDKRYLIKNTVCASRSQSFCNNF